MGLRKKVAVVLGLAAAAAAGFCIYIQANIDTQAPEITFGTDLTAVTADMTKEELIADVKATDNKDGDISSQVIIGEQTITGDMVELIYIVADKAGNVASKVRILPYQAEDGTSVSQTVSSNENPEESQETEALSEEETGEETESAEESTESVPEETPVPEIPVVTLNQNSVTLPVGTHFEYGSYIASVTDDKDTREQLYRNLVVTGYYDVNTPGTYPLEYWVMDSDYNESVRQSFTLIIE